MLKFTYILHKKHWKNIVGLILTIDSSIVNPHKKSYTYKKMNFDFLSPNLFTFLPRRSTTKVKILKLGKIKKFVKSNVIFKTLISSVCLHFVVIELVLPDILVKNAKYGPKSSKFSQNILTSLVKWQLLTISLLRSGLCKWERDTFVQFTYPGLYKFKANYALPSGKKATEKQNYFLLWGIFQSQFHCFWLIVLRWKSVSIIQSR